MRIPLTRYGLPQIIYGTVLCAALAWCCVLTIPLLVVVPGALWLFLLAFFRDPERPCEARPEELLSPADGTVADIEEVDPAEFLAGRALRIGVFMSVADVHVNRAPAAGTVRFVKHVPGAFCDARTERSKSDNEHSFLGMETTNGRRILVRQVAGVIARRIVCRVQAGDALARGERFGMVKFGSRLELYVPLSDRPVAQVKVGQHVKAGRDVLVRYGSADSAA
jgi:phosphatidylserine decarboxylase